MNRQRKQKIRDIQSDDELPESGPEISDAEDYAEGRILIPDIYRDNFLGIRYLLICSFSGIIFWVNCLFFLHASRLQNCGLKKILVVKLCFVTFKMAKSVFLFKILYCCFRYIFFIFPKIFQKWPKS